MKSRFIVNGALAVGLAIGGASSPPPTAAADPLPDETLTVHITDPTNDLRLAKRTVQWRSGAGSNRNAIPVDPTRRYQSMIGFGASMTDSSARNLASLSPAQHRAAIEDLFGAEGLRLNLLRVPLGASDFSGQGSYTYNDLPADQRDDKLQHVSLDRDRENVFPQLQAANSAAGSKLTLIGSPWTAPAWMKESQSLHGGSLRSDSQDAFARYLARVASLYQQIGLPLDYLTIQNEPLHTSDGYPTMQMDVQQAQAITQKLESELTTNSPETRILTYDHNWDVSAYTSQVLANAGSTVEGTAWHCYGGQAITQSQVHNTFPGRTAHLTECSGGDWQGSTADAFAGTMYVLTQAPAHWARSVTLWNLALDTNHGPTNGGCDNCRGVITVHPDGTWNKEIDYWALAHFSRFVEPGARRIASGTLAGVNNVAFTNPDGTHVLVAHNADDTEREVNLRFGDRHAPFTIPAHGAATVSWHGQGQELATGSVDLHWGNGLTATFDQAVIEDMDSILIDGKWFHWNAPAGADPRIPGKLQSLDRSRWRASASNEASEADKAIDGDPSTRWSSGTGLSDGQWLQIDLGARTEFDRIVLDNASSPNDFSRRFSIEVSNDAQHWRRIARAAGTPSSSQVQLAPTSARYVRILNHSNSGSWWSVHEVDVLRTITDTSPPAGTLLTAEAALGSEMSLRGWFNASDVGQQFVTRLGSVTFTGELPPQGAFTLAHEGSDSADAPSPDDDVDDEPSLPAPPKPDRPPIGLPSTGI